MSWSDVSPIVGDLAMGGFAGFSVGYFAKKFLKVVAFIVGAYTASLIYLSARGFISVNWDAFGVAADGVLASIGQLSLSVGVLGTGAAAGFLLGWKSG